MVENQHGLGSVLSFSAKSVSPQVLESLLVGREKIVNQLENRVKNISNDGLNHQVLLVGARGTGKTHMLSVLHNRMQSIIAENKIKVAYFAEEEYGISGFLDFMVRILNAFIRWNDEDAEFLKSQLTILQETSSSHQEDTIKRIIRDYVGEKPLLILAENFNDILDAIKKDGQSKLRNWLQENNRISIIATSQALSDDIGKEDKPFYGFFDEINIVPLNLEQSFELLKNLAKIENRIDVINHLENKGKAQVKAINTLVKGNHRLLITFYQFLKSDVLSNLSVMFIKTLNDLKPYYETYIRYQPPQQQKIIRFLALAKSPQRGADIARECFIDQKSLSKQMSELSRKKLIDIVVDPDDKRNKLYDISEPLLRISIEIGEQREGISALFIDFLALYYDQEELNSQKEKFSEIYSKCIDPKEKQQYSFEISARDKALQVQSKLNENNSNNSVFGEIIKSIEKNDFQKALTDLNTIENKNENESFFFSRAVIFSLQEKYVKAKKDIMKAIELNSTEDSNWFILGDIQYKLNQNNEAIDAFNKSLKINPENESSLIGLGKIYYITEQYDLCIKNLNKVIEINPNNYDAFLIKGEALLEIKEYKEANEYLIKANKINPEDSYTLQCLGVSYGYLKKFKKAINAFENALQLNPKSPDITLVLAATLLHQNDTNKAIPLLFELIEVIDNIEDSEKINWAITKILKHDDSLTIEKCFKIEKTIIDKFKKHDDVKISLILLKTFKKVVLENNKKALYKLPKEQREFFTKEIISFREKANAQPKKPRKKQ